MIGRIGRDTVLICLAMALATAACTRRWSTPLGVIGGGALIGLSFWAIRGAVDAWFGTRVEGETARKSAPSTLVKFFTRHAIVAVAAYGMMVRLHLDPVGLLLGVSTLGAAVAVEAVRGFRWRRFP